jgi:putative flippase GtrA
MNLLTVVFKVPKLFAQAISFTLAVVNNFLLNRSWTYPKSRAKSFIQQFLLFFVISVIGLGIRTPLFWGLSLGITHLSKTILSVPSIVEPGIIGNNIALAICIVVVLLWNYFANRKWTFNDTQNTKSSNDKSSTAA